MLLEFTVGNFLSFRENQTLSMFADPLKEMKENAHIPYHYDINLRVLKSIAFHGHNSHGKSNFFKAYRFFSQTILNSFLMGSSTRIKNIESFQLNTDSINRPSFFEIIFILKNIKYRYNFSATSEDIFVEELYYAEPRIRENYLFKREEQKFIISKQWNKENSGEIEQSVKFAKKHILFLSVLLSQEIDSMKELENWFGNNIIVTNINEQIIFDKAMNFSQNDEYAGLIQKFIDNGDLGFTTVIDKAKSQIANNRLKLSDDIFYLLNYNGIKNFDLVTIHNQFHKDFELAGTMYFDMQKNESSGSIKYFIIACLLSYAIKTGQIVWIDELDSRLHPFLLEMILKIFNSSKFNSFGGQLIFTSHNTVLMNKKLRRDQIVFVEKNDFGESSIRKAHTPKTPIRTDISIEKEYLKGELKGVSKKIKKTIDRNLFDGL